MLPTNQFILFFIKKCNYRTIKDRTVFKFLNFNKKIKNIYICIFIFEYLYNIFVVINFNNNKN